MNDFLIVLYMLVGSILASSLIAVDCACKITRSRLLTVIAVTLFWLPMLVLVMIIELSKMVVKNRG